MRFSSSFFLGAAALLASISSCASYKVIPITAANTATAEGVRYCRPAPYLLVLPAGTSVVSAGADSAASSPYAAMLGMFGGGGAKAAAPTPRYQIVYLPDPAQTFAIQRHGGMGTAEVSATLVNGWLLTNYGSKTDAKVPEALAAVAAAVSAATSGAAKGAPEDELAPGLYKIDLTGAALTLTKVVRK